MAKQLHHKSSRGSSNRDRRGLVGGVVYPLFHLRRMLLGRRQRRVGEDASGLKYLKLKPDVPSAGEQHVFMDNEMQGEIKYSEGKNEVYDELGGVSALPKKLTRTLSIHHLECNDYVLKSGENGSHEQSEATGSLSNANNMVHNQVDGSSYQLFKEHSSLQEENREASVSLLEYQKTHDRYENRDVGGNRTKCPIGALELYNAGKEIFLKILQDEDHISENHKQHFQDSDPALVLTKSNSYPRLGSLRNYTSFSKRRPILDDNNPSVRQEEKSKASSLESCMGGQKGILGPDHRRLDDGVTSGSSRFTSVAHNLKVQDSVDKENKKEKYRISMDSVLHKLPYGQEVLQNMRIEKSGIADRLTPHFKKSMSLTESMDRYSLLLDSNFSRESDNHVFQRSKSLREDGPFPTMNRSKTLGHIHSLHKFEPCFSRKDALFEASHAIYSSKPSPLNSKRTDSVNEIIVPLEEDIVGAVNTKGASETSDVVDNQHLGHASENDFLETNIGEEQRISSTNSYEYEKFEHSDEMLQVRIACKPSDDQELGPECCYSDEGKSLSPVSDVKSKLQQDLNSMETYLLPEENAELTPECIASEKLNSSAHLETQDINSRLCPNSSAYDTIRVEIDSKDEAEFNFVRELLKKSGFSGNELSKAWNSTEQPVDFSLFEVVEGSKCRLDFGLYAPDINLDHLLLFDLINEVLLETYSSVLNPWLSCFSSGIRQVAVGSRVLEEVWAKIHWHRSYQLQLDPSLEFRNDGWIDVRYETEYLGQELAALMLDDLLDEAIQWQ